MTKFAGNLKKLRKSKGVTQEQMRDYGFNYRYYQKMEAGQVNIRLDVIVRLVNTFKCSISDLFK